MRRSLAASVCLLLLVAPGAWAGEITIRPTLVEDRKAVFATVEPVRQLVARSRIGGTIASLDQGKASRACCLVARGLRV